MRKIHERNATLTNFGGDGEVDILYSTWASADENAKNFLLKELLDAAPEYSKNNGPQNVGLYCPTGVASRIVNASLVNEPEKMAKTKEVIHQEMMQTAANLRSKLEETDEYKQLDDTQQTEKLKETINQKYKEEYIDSGLMSKQEVDDMTKEWIDHV